MTKDFKKAVEAMFIELEDNQQDVIGSDEEYVYDKWMLKVLQIIHSKVINDDEFLNELYEETKPLTIDLPSRIRRNSND